MNLAHLKKSIGYWVKLQPVPIRLNAIGLPLPAFDDDWLIRSESERGLEVINLRTHHVTTLAPDHIHHFTSDPERSKYGTPHSFLQLLVQIYLKGSELWIKPTLRPGEPLPPPSVRIVENIVDFRYPTDSGLQQRFELRGHRVGWTKKSRLSRNVDLEGWKRVTVVNVDGDLTQFRSSNRRDDLILVYRPVPCGMPGPHS